MTRLTAAFVRDAKYTPTRQDGGKRGKGPVRFHDSNGLCLQIMPSGAKQFVQRVSLDRGRRIDIGLGGYPMVGLERARKAALANAAAAWEYRRAVLRGESPDLPGFAHAAQVTAAKRKKQAVPALSAARAGGGGMKLADAWEMCITERSPAWKDAKTNLQKYRGTLKNHLASLARRPVADVSVDDLRQALLPLPLKTRETTLARVGTVFDWVVAGGHRPDNPAKTLRATWRGLAKTEPSHREAMALDEVPAFFRRLRERPDKAGAAGALALVVACGFRALEGAGLQWCEVDREAGTIAIPAARFKLGTPFVQPLNAAALAVLDDAGPRRASGPVFRAQRGGPLLSQHLLRVVRQLGETDATVHGFRSCIGSFLQPLVSYEVRERVLGHVVGSAVARSYHRDPQLAEKVAALAAWSDHLLSAR